MNFPLISVIIPIYNREAFLPKLLENVVCQNYFPIEIIIVDDGSTDRSANVVKANPHVKYIYQTNQGPATARNTGLAAAEGEFIAFIDSDDLWAAKTLQILSECLIKNKHIDIAEGLIQEINLEGGIPSKNASLPSFYSCLLGSSLIRKSVFNKVGGFDERLLYAEDVDWFIRAWEMNVTKQRINYISLYYRKHASNMTNNDVERTQYRLLLYKIKIARQKQQLQPLLPATNLKDFLGEPSRDKIKI